MPHQANVCSFLMGQEPSDDRTLPFHIKLITQFNICWLPGAVNFKYLFLVSLRWLFLCHSSGSWEPSFSCNTQYSQSLWFTCDRTPSLSQDPLGCVFSRLNIDFWGSQFWPPNLSCLKVVLNFWSSVKGVHPPGILALCQKKLFEVLKQTKCFLFPL